MSKSINLLTLTLFLLNISCLKIKNKNEISDTRIQTEKTPIQDGGHGNIHFLDRHVIYCPAGSAMTMFHHLRASANSINYEKS
jgi:hypothetical protein